MGNIKTIIELNGKKYDARTGQMLSDDKPAIQTQVSAPKNNEPKVVDGFVRKPTPRVAKKFASPAVINHTKRQLSKSKTLMRPSVQKPSEIKNDIQKVKYITKPSHASAVRQSRAESTQKSHLVSKFNPVKTELKKSVEHLPVVSAPTSAFSSSKKMAENELEKFEQALKSAGTNIHNLEKDTLKKVPFLKRVGFKNRFANIATMCAGFLLLVGFFAYQNSAAISMRVASARSGVQAQMPGYTPAGFSPERTVDSSDGKVSISFRSNSDDKVFTLTQQASNWNSGSLLVNHVQKRNCTTCFQTWQNEGKTVYIYDNSNATWVDGGVWYQIEGNAPLTSDQLLRLANSL